MFTHYKYEARSVRRELQTKARIADQRCENSAKEKIHGWHGCPAACAKHMLLPRLFVRITTRFTLCCPTTSQPEFAHDATFWETLRHCLGGLARRTLAALPDFHAGRCGGLRRCPRATRRGSWLLKACGLNSGGGVDNGWATCPAWFSLMKAGGGGMKTISDWPHGWQRRATLMCNLY